MSSSALRLKKVAEDAEAVAVQSLQASENALLHTEQTVANLLKIDEIIAQFDQVDSPLLPYNDSPLVINDIDISQLCLDNFEHIAGQPMVTLDYSDSDALELFAKETHGKMLNRLRNEMVNRLTVALKEKLDLINACTTARDLHEFLVKNMAEMVTVERSQEGLESEYVWTVTFAFASYWKSELLLRDHLERWFLAKVHSPVTMVLQSIPYSNIKISEARSTAVSQIFNLGRSKASEISNPYKHDMVMSVDDLGMEILLVEAAASDETKKQEEDRKKLAVALPCLLLSIFLKLPPHVRSRFREIRVFGVLMGGLSVSLLEAQWSVRGTIELYEIGYFQLPTTGVKIQNLTKGLLRMLQFAAKVNASINKIKELFAVQQPKDLPPSPMRSFKRKDETRSQSLGTLAQNDHITTSKSSDKRKGGEQGQGQGSDRVELRRGVQRYQPGCSQSKEACEHVRPALDELNAVIASIASAAKESAIEAWTRIQG
ncbi:hypothetical protein BGX26_005121 [Mortierella sp. AD094]|nr:hypothetical protein BGX26_005121 [Mortierella sp. AD094]